MFTPRAIQIAENLNSLFNKNVGAKHYGYILQLSYIQRLSS